MNLFIFSINFFCHVPKWFDKLSISMRFDGQISYLKEVIMNSVCIIILLTKLIVLPPNGWESIDEIFYEVIFYEVIFIIVLGKGRAHS